MSVSRISRQSGHALPQHWMHSAWNRTLSIGLSPAEVYSVCLLKSLSACSQVVYGLLASSWALKSHHTTLEYTLSTIFSISFRSISFRSVPGFITSPSVQRFAHKFATRIRACATFGGDFELKFRACANSRRKFCANQPANLCSTAVL